MEKPYRRSMQLLAHVHNQQRRQEQSHSDLRDLLRALLANKLKLRRYHPRSNGQQDCNRGLQRAEKRDNDVVGHDARQGDACTKDRVRSDKGTRELCWGNTDKARDSYMRSLSARRADPQEGIHRGWRFVPNVMLLALEKGTVEVGCSQAARVLRDGVREIRVTGYSLTSLPSSGTSDMLGTSAPNVVVRARFEACFMHNDPPRKSSVQGCAGDPSTFLGRLPARSVLPSCCAS